MNREQMCPHCHGLRKDANNQPCLLCDYTGWVYGNPEPLDALVEKVLEGLQWTTNMETPARQVVIRDTDRWGSEWRGLKHFKEMNNAST